MREEAAASRGHDKHEQEQEIILTQEDHMLRRQAPSVSPRVCTIALHHVVYISQVSGRCTYSFPDEL